jgi:hypothetical protein
MIYEFRTYTVKPGTVQEVEARFAEALPHRMKYSKMAAFWHTELGPLNQVIHVWPYASLQQRMEIRKQAARDPNWPPKTDKYIISMDAEIWSPAPFSPSLEGAKKLGDIYEMRIYRCQPRSIPEIMKLWAKSLPDRVKLSPIAACMYSEVGTVNRWMHIWPYKDMDERDCIRIKAKELPTWPPLSGTEYVLIQQNKILIPASFSPLA